jgi:hypothetical protein
VRQVLAHQGQAGLGAQVKGKLFDQKFTHRASHLQGEVQMQDKLLISMVKSANQQIIGAKSRIQVTARPS